MSGRTRVRLGSGYRRLWTATAVSSLGDGVYFTALPLLAASLTRDPVAVSLVTLATTLPNLLLTLTAGVLVDRWDRRRVLWRVLAVVGRSLTSSAVERARAQAALEERPSGAVAT
jgi:MFS family permease